MRILILILFITLGLGVKSQTFWGKYVHVCNLESTDPEGGETYWTINAGNTPKVFAIMPCSGELKVDTTVYSTFVNSKTFTLTIRSTDALGLYAVAKRKVTLKKALGVRITSVVTTVQ